MNSTKIAAANAQRVWIGDLVGRDDGRPHGCEGVARLAALPLLVGELQVARADVVHVRVAEDVIIRTLTRDAFRPAASLF